MQRVLLKIASIAMLALTACGPTEPQLSRGTAPLLRSFERAAEQSGVPVDLLLAIAYTESRFSLRQGPSRLGGHGPMHLRQGSTLQRAARLSGEAEAMLATELDRNVRGAALVLRELAGPELPSDLRGWAPALAGYSGLGPDGGVYAAEILRLLAAGVQGSDDEGRLIEIPPHPELGGPAALPPGLGRWQEALTPDYPGAQWQGPACHSSDRAGTPISMVIIHTCQGGFTGCWGWLKGCNDVSAHYVISSTGTIVQLVEERLKAWHAGCVNSKSVGIEHEGYVENPDKWFTEAMYCASAKLVKSICERNGFPCDRDHVIGHDEANKLYCNGTHTDPGSGWNWGKLMGYVANGCGAPPVTDRPQLTISGSILELVGQERDLCRLGGSEGVFDWWSGQITDATVDVKNAGTAAAREVEVGISVEEPYLVVQRWEILSDGAKGGSFTVNDTDAMQKIPRDLPGGSFRLWLGAFAAGETKRVQLRVRAATGSLGAAVLHPGLRAFVARIGDGVYEKASFEARPTVNLENSQTQNGGDLRASFATDVLERELCDDRDNNCDGVVDEECSGSPDSGVGPAPAPAAGGCGCSVGQASPSPAGELVLLLLAAGLALLLIAARPRRRRWSTSQNCLSRR